MKKIIKPTVDCVFKAILGSNENKSLLINFLNAVLGLIKGQFIKDVHILNPYNEKEFKDKLFSPEKGAVDQADKYLHLNFKPYDVNAKIYLSNHLDIHVLQLPFFKKEQLIQDDKDRWLYFFKEGQNLEINNLPKYLKTKEIMKAMETLNHFSNDQKAYLLYQDRLEATRVASTWQSLLKQKDSEIQMKDSEIKKLRTLIHQMGGQA